MDFTLFLDIIGTIAFALSGYILGSKAQLDILGIFFISSVTSFGGGVVRDLLVDRTPFIFQETYPATIVLITITIAYFLKLHHNTKLTDNYIFIVTDSIGLSIFAFTGATIAIINEFNFGGVVFLAFLTAVGGGIIRDIVLNKIPFIFVSEFYGTVAILIGIITWIINTFYIINTFTIIGILLFGFIMRLLAFKYNWRLPKLIDN